MTNGYYLTIALKDTTDPSTGIGSAIGWNAILYYQNFKSGGTNDNEIPDFNLEIRQFYPLGNTPPLNDPEVLGDEFGNSRKLSGVGIERGVLMRFVGIMFLDGSSVKGSVRFGGVEVGDVAGTLVKSVSGAENVEYTIVKGDGRVFYTDADGVQYKCMHFARNPLIVG